MIPFAVTFDTPLRAVAPGQAAVFYGVGDESDRVLGGGTIIRGTTAGRIVPILLITEGPCFQVQSRQADNGRKRQEVYEFKRVRSGRDGR